MFRISFPLLLVAAILFLSIDNAVAQRVITLFKDSEVATTSSSVAKGTADRTYLNVDFESLKSGLISPGDLLELDIDNDNLLLEIVRVERYMPGTVSLIAKNANTEELFIFTVTDDNRLFGKLHLDGHKMYHFDYDPEKSAVYRHEITETLDELSCGNDSINEVPTFEMISDATSSKSTSLQTTLPHSGAIASNEDDEITIDVMIVYSRAAVSWSSVSNFGSMEAVIAQSMALSQGALDNSDVDVRLRLVHSAQIEYEESVNGESGSDLLRKLTASPTFSLGSDFDNSMDEVHTLRDQYGADLVAGFFQYINDVGGIAWRLSNPAGFPQFGFSVNRVQQIATGYTLIHEIGHNVGISHARNQDPRNAASKVGGLFEYSVGYRTGSGFDGFNTIMAYAEGIENEAPLFSSPDLTFLDAPAGSAVDDFISGYTDARRNWREIKSVIASYRPTRVDPPALTQTQNNIQVSMDRESQSTVPVSIQNTGASDLMWTINFGVPGTGVLTKSTGDYGVMMETDSPTSILEAPGASAMPLADEDGLILAENFDTFFIGVQSVQKEWRMSNDNMKYQVLSQNPSQGAKHIRISRRSSVDGTMFFRSPYFGRQPFGELDISMDVSFGHTTQRGSWERFDIYFYDVVTGDLSAGFVFGEDGTVYTFDESSGNFAGTPFQYDVNTYYTVRVFFNVNTGHIEYHIDDQKIAERPLIEKRSIDYMNILHFNEVEGSFIDIDNFEFKRTKLFDWLEVDTYAGVVKPGESGTFNLEFDTRGVPSGEYAVNLYLDSNDPIESTSVIPVRVNVTTTTSVDDAGVLPNEIALRQNYPNPFNPSTSISYELPAADFVRLEIFDVLGRSVSVLVDETVEAGSHTVRFDASSLSSGIYVYRLTAGGQAITRQMMLIR